MAFNFGAFAGGLSKGFSDTYRMLSEEEERELAMKERRDRMTREAQARTAALETIGRSGQDTYTPELEARGAGTTQAKALEQQNAGFGPEGYAEASRATAGALSREAVPTDMKSRTYKESEAVGDYARRLAAIDPDKALATSTQARQLKQLERVEKLQEDYDKQAGVIRQNVVAMQNIAETGNLDAFMDLTKKNGLDVRKTTDKKTGALTLSLYENGKVVGTANSLQEAVGQLTPLYMAREAEKFMLLFSNDPKEFFKATLDIRANQRADETLDIAKQKLPGEMAYTAAQTKKALAETAGAELKGREAKEYADLRSKMLTILENPTAENQAELRQLARRAAILNPKEVLVTKAYTDPETGIAKTITTNVLTGEVQESLREAGVPGPAAMRAAESGVNPKTGKPFTDKEINEWNERFPNTPFPGRKPAASANAAPSAIPVAPSKPAAPAATRGTAVAAGNRVPEPPPKEIMRGTNRLPNPAYVEWEKRYGQQYNAQQR